MKNFNQFSKHLKTPFKTLPTALKGKETNMLIINFYRAYLVSMTLCYIFYR